MTLHQPILVLGLAACAATAVQAEVVRLEIQSRETATRGTAGARGPFEIVRGLVHGEIDPADPHNAIIQDVELAPRNARGRVEYVATFALAVPVDRSKAARVLLYQVVNRGNGQVTLGEEGYVSLISGWQGDLAPSSRLQTIRVPIATQPDGSAITGPVLARLVDVPGGHTTAALRLSSMGSGPLQYPPAGLSQPTATLTMHASETPTGVLTGTEVVPRADWAFATCETTPFPGTPDPNHLCVKGGFRADRIYDLVYTARDPLVLGVGLAATRDIVSFFRYEKADRLGTPNPVAGLVDRAVSIGDSQSGNFIKTFIHLGFNQDEGNRIVWDGAFPRIAARQTPINFRFALPGGAATLYELGSEGVLWWSRYEDRARGLPPASFLDRCGRTRTCPKIIEAFGSAEFWGLRMSPGLIGTDAKGDIPLPDTVRRYYYPGTHHGGGRGGFQIEPQSVSPAARCVLPDNPNPESDTTRALTRALVEWVTNGTAPPDSRYPLLARGELVPATRGAIGLPDIPGLRFNDRILNPMLHYGFGPRFRPADVSGIIDAWPPPIRQVIPTYVPRVNGDGNEMVGVPSVLHQAPLGTYLGWNVTRTGFFAGAGCGFSGGYVPFARTAAERLKTHDPRPSVEERYGTLEGYVCVVQRAADQAVRERFLLPEDARRLIAQAQSSAVLPTASQSSAENRARGEGRSSTGEIGTGVEDQWIQNQMVRLTWQINQKNKFSVYHDRYPKFKGHEVIGGFIADWDKASGRRDPEHALYYTGQAKWTSTLTNKLLLEAGYSTNVEYLFIGYQPGVQQERNTPAWFSNIGKQDLITLRAYDGRISPANGIDPKANNINGILSYVTGSHAFKTGVNWTFGDYVLEYDINGDLVQLYRNGAPDSVRVYNTPVRANEYLNANLGMFVQDAWTVNRMTLNMGVRFERFVGQIKNQEIGEGRFAPARTFNEVTGLPSWFDVSPRLGVSYDLFGTGRTALKATFGKYMAGQTTSFPARYNPLQIQSDTRSWRDLNGDNVAQNNEIGPSNNAAFGLPVQTVRPDPDIKREYDLEYTAQVQHEVIQGLSLSFGYYRRGTHNQRVTRNLGWSDSDYTIINVVSPLDGTVIPIYNLNPALRANVDRLDENSTNSDLRRRTYNGLQTGFNARVAGFQFFGGWTMDRIVDVRCDAIESNAGRYAGTAAIAASNQPQPDFHWCDQSQLDMPFQHEFKVAGSYTLPWYGIQANVALQSYNGQPLFTRWNIGQATRYAANCVGPCRPGELVVPNLTLPNYVVDLVAPGEEFYARQNQLDMGFRKVFRVGRYQVSGQVDIFNIVNSSYVKSQNITYAVQSPTASFNTFGQPLDILQPRTFRLAAQLKF